MEVKLKRKGRGGARDGAGRPSGITKKKICVSVDMKLWQHASSNWSGTASKLVELALREHFRMEA